MYVLEMTCLNFQTCLISKELQDREVTLHVLFRPYVGFPNDIPVYETVLNTQEQKFTLRCASHVCQTAD